MSRVLGPASGLSSEMPLVEAVVAVSGRAGVPVWIPGNARGHCCGLPFSSKGYDRASAAATARTVESLWLWTDGGRLPVVTDSSPCALTLRRCSPELSGTNRERLRSMRILDGIEFAHDHLLPTLNPVREGGVVVLHPTCSVYTMELVGKLVRVAEACSSGAEVPRSAGCCGFAGDRGFVLPRLTYAATRVEAREVSAAHYSGYFSSSRTCEIGMERATGKPYRSFWNLLERTTRS
jgi:D-lactate dehydrogenase